MIKKIGDILRTIYWAMSVTMVGLTIAMPDWFIKIIRRISFKIVKDSFKIED